MALKDTAAEFVLGQIERPGGCRVIPAISGKVIAFSLAGPVNTPIELFKVGAHAQQGKMLPTLPAVGFFGQAGEMGLFDIFMRPGNADTPVLPERIARAA